ELGYVVENDQLLGSESSGALSLGQGTSTAYIGVNGAYYPLDNTKLFAAFYAGYSSVNMANDSLFTDISALKTSSFTLGASRANTFKPNDVVGVIAHQPLRVNSGEATMTLANGYTGNQFAFADSTVNLAPQDRQINYELFYNFNTHFMDDIKLSYLHIQNPGHNKAQGSEQALFYTMETRF
ncbi:MAG: hypothetical protein ACPGPF_06730, partial [Pontibacterium sp.]